MKSYEAEHVSWEVDGLRYAGLAWGDRSAPVALALHGWMDNALSFSRLGPLLTQRRLIAIDLSGHGLSDHRSADATYQIWDDIPQLVQIIDQCANEKVTLIGHSRGAAISILLAAVLQERCDSLVVIDGLMPADPDSDDAARQLRQFIADRVKYAGRGERVFPSMEDFIAARTRYGFTEENAKCLADRALERVKDGWRLRADPRLFGASAVRMQAREREFFYRGLTMPVLGIFGSEGFFHNEPAKALMAEAARCIPDYRSTMLGGSHHLHLEADVEHIAWRIDSFIESGC